MEYLDKFQDNCFQRQIAVVALPGRTPVTGGRRLGSSPEWGEGAAPGPEWEWGPWAQPGRG